MKRAPSILAALLLLWALVPRPSAAADRNPPPVPRTEWLRAPGCSTAAPRSSSATRDGEANYRRFRRGLSPRGWPPAKGDLAVARVPQSQTAAMEDCPYGDCGGDSEPPPPPPPSGKPSCQMNQYNVDEMPNYWTTPLPTAGGNCNCVVKISTTNRIVRGTTLYQECGDHYDHCSVCSGRDYGHSSPLGIWGVQTRLEGAIDAVESPLINATPTEPSQAQDGPQWPSSLNADGHTGDWNTCTCDTQHLNSTDPDHKYFKPNPPASAEAVAGWFKITSSSQTCEPLTGQPMRVGFTLYLWELDPYDSYTGLGLDDYILAFPKHATQIPVINCDPSNGACVGETSIPFGDANYPVEATGKVSVVCSSRPWNQQASSCQCGDGSCCDGEWYSCPQDCGWVGGGPVDECCTCDCDGNGWVGRNECYSGCGGYVSGGYCVTG
jgi:hypothetical protein